MNNLGKLWVLGLVFILILSIAPLKADGAGVAKLKIRPVRLEILDDGSGSEQDLDDWMYTQGPNGIVIVFSAMFGNTNKQDTEIFPKYRVSIRNSNSLMFSIDFKVNSNAKLQIIPLISGPVAGFMLEDEGDEFFEVNAQKNVYYRQIFEIDMTDLDPGSIVPGVYDIMIIVVPAESAMPMRKTGGMTYATCRLWLVN
ncbi:hypothetical protein ACFLT2_04880 [Acidobacteriota bacterium]